MRKKAIQKTYVSIRNNEKERPVFFMEWEELKTIWWRIVWIDTESKEIIPKSWPSQGKKVTVKNLLIDIVDDDGEFTLQLGLYDSLSRHVMNTLAGKSPLDYLVFDVYKNKQGYRALSIKEKDDFNAPRCEWYRTWDELGKLVGKKIVQWEEKPDYDKATDECIDTLIPIIEKKIEKVREKYDNVFDWEDKEEADDSLWEDFEKEAESKSKEAEKKESKKSKGDEDEDLPF